MSIGKAFPGGVLNPFGGLYTSGNEDKLILEGVVFGVASRFIIPGGETRYVLLDPRAFTGVAMFQLPALLKGFGGGPLEINLYTDPTYTGGAVVGASNFNLKSANIADLVVLFNPTVTATGVKSPNEYYVFSGGQGRTEIGGEAAPGRLSYILDTTKQYLYEIINVDTSDAYCNVVVDWAEVK